MIESLNEFLFLPGQTILSGPLHNRSFIRFAHNFYFQFIIMAMVMGQCTFTKYFFILFIIPPGLNNR